MNLNDMNRMGMASHEYEIGKEEKKMKKTLIHLGMP